MGSCCVHQGRKGSTPEWWCDRCYRCIPVAVVHRLPWRKCMACMRAGPARDFSVVRVLSPDHHEHAECRKELGVDWMSGALQMEVVQE